jgi:hypothetical protein
MIEASPKSESLTEKPALVTLGEQHPVVHLDRDFPADS